MHRAHRPWVVLAGALLAVPLAVTLAGSGQAAPTLTIAQAQAQIAALQMQEDAAVEAYDAGQIVATDAAQKASVAQALVVTQTARMNEMYAGIRSFAVASYRTGGIDPLSEMLAGGDAETLLQRAGDLDQISKVQQARVKAVATQRVVLSVAQHAADQQAGQAATALRTLSDSRVHILGLIAQQQQVLSHLQAVARAELLAQQRAAAARARAAALVAQKHAEAVQAAQVQAARVQAARDAARRLLVAAPVARGTHGSSGSPAPTPPPVYTAPVSTGGSSSAGLIALRAAETQMGDPYVWGAAGPSTYDCSGLVLWAFAHAGVSLPHSAAAQYGYGTHVSLSAMQPGDLVFYDDGATIGHVGIYVGGGMMLDANHSGGWVGIRPLYSNPVGATRI